MYGARFAVFARRARVLPSRSQPTRNLSFLEVSPAPITLLFQVVVSLDWYGLVCICHSMEILQTCTRTWWWCVSMFGARFAVFARRARVLPIPSQATRNLFVFLRFQRRRHVGVTSCCFTGLVRVGLNFPLNGNRANMHAHVVAVCEHVWRTLCSVCKTGARVAQSFPTNS